jgi:glycerophosphoryl diester phosphodiesterase
MEIFLLSTFIFTYFFVRFFWNWRAEAWPTQHFQLPRIQVHRGYWLEGLQENTIAAFREACKRGAEMVELDVQLSSDQIPIVFHDDDISRFSSRKDFVPQLTAKELKDLVQAPSLKEVLQDTEGPKYFNIEIKCSQFRSNGLEKHIAQVVTECGADSRVIFSSFNPAVLRRISKFLPEIPRALLVTDDKNDSSGVIYLRQMWFGGYARAHMVNLNHKMLNPFLQRRLDERKIPIAVWTVNDNLRAEMLIKNHGVVSVISDQFPIGN